MQCVNRPYDGRDAFIFWDKSEFDALDAGFGSAMADSCVP